MSILTNGLCHRNILANGLGERISLFLENNILPKEIFKIRPVVLKHKTTPSPTTTVVNVEMDINETLTPENYKMVSQLLEINGKFVENKISENLILILPSNGSPTDILVEKIEIKQIIPIVQSENVLIKKLNEEFRIKVRLIK